EVPAPGRQPAVDLPAGDRGRFLRRAVDGGDAEAGPGPQLLVRLAGLGIRRPGPVLAVVPVRRPAAVAHPGRSCPVAGDAQGRRVALDRGPAVPVGGRDRRVLFGRPDVGRAQPPVDGRVLALVGGTPVGGRLLRGLRGGGNRLPVHPPGPAAGAFGHRRGVVRHHHLHGRRRARHPAPP